MTPTELLLRAGAWAQTYLLHSTLLLGAVAAVGATVGRRREWLMDGLWKAALVGGFVTASLQAMLDLRPAAGAIELRGPVPAGAREVVVDETVSLRPGQVPVVATRRRERAVSRWDAARTGSPVLLGGLWVIVALGMAVRGARGATAVRRALAHRVPCTDRRVLEAVASLRACAALPAVQVSALPGLPGPLAVGSREVCVPDTLADRLAPAALRAVLAHELAHLARRDPMWLRLLLLVRVAGVVQPLNVFGIAAWRRVAELACDARAAGQTGAARPLAEALVALARPVHRALHAAPAFASSRGRGLAQRVERLLERPAPSRAPGWVAPLLGLIIVVLTCGVAPRVVAPRAVPGGWVQDHVELRGAALP